MVTYNISIITNDISGNLILNSVDYSIVLKRTVDDKILLKQITKG